MPSLLRGIRLSLRREDVNATQKTARFAGALYLLSSVAAGVPLIYVSNSLIVPGNAAATANKILGSEMFFRAGIVSELIGAVVFIFMVRALYRLLSGVNKNHASLMVILVLVSVPITFLNAMNEIAALTLLHGDHFPLAFDKNQREALALVFLNLHGDGATLANIFWGLWLFPFGVLVMRSGFLPRLLGALLLLNGFALVPSALRGSCCQWIWMLLTDLRLFRSLENYGRWPGFLSRALECSRRTVVLHRGRASSKSRDR